MTWIAYSGFVVLTKPLVIGVAIVLIVATMAEERHEVVKSGTRPRSAARGCGCCYFILFLYYLS